VIAADDEQFLAGRSVPPGRIIVHATVAHVHAIDDGITKRSAALDDPPTHGSDIVIYQRSCQPMARCTASGSHAVWRVSPHLLAAFEATQMKSVRLPRRLAAHSRISYPHLSPSYAQQYSFHRRDKISRQLCRITKR